MAIFEGAGVALITPMNADGSINYDKMEELVEFHIANQTDAIIVCGTTGEAATMTHEEHLATIKACVEMTKKRIPVIAGTGSNCTETSIYLSQEAEKYGADGVLLVSPYYNKATQEGLKQHFTKTAEAIKIPCILYNVPSRTGCNIKPATVKELVEEVPNIVAIKEASENISQVADVMNLTDGKIDLYSGCDDQIVPALSLGGKGVISVLSNVAPKDTHNICQNYFDGNVKESARLQLHYLDLIHALFSEVNPIPVKKAMNLMGYEVGSLRLPLTEMSEEAAKVLEAELKKCNLI